MDSKVKLLGHPLHPIMVVFPLGLLITSVIFDLIHWNTGNGFWSEIAFWVIAVGLVGGIIAAGIGTIDWIEIVAKNIDKYCNAYTPSLHLRLLTHKLGGRLDYGQPFACFHA